MHIHVHMRSVIELFAFATDLLATAENALNIILKRAKLNALADTQNPVPETQKPPPSHRTIARAHFEKHA